MQGSCGLQGQGRQCQTAYGAYEEEGEAFPYDSVEVLLERAKGKYPSGMNKEGIVIRPVEPVYSGTIDAPLSMKVLNNDYLLQGDSGKAHQKSAVK